MKHILMVDDSKTNLAVTKSALEDTYKVTAVTTGVQALKFLEKNGCDLILLDINMPEMDGFEVLSRIKNDPATADIPVVFLTAGNDAQEWSRCIDSGAMDIMEKPFVKNVLLARIGHILELMDLRGKK